jgi:hypothetical protein
MTNHTFEYWQNLARVATRGLTPEQIDQVAAICYNYEDDKISVWHAVSVVLKTKCHCMRCEPTR